MEKIFETKGKIISDEDSSVQENVIMYEVSPEELEDFELLSHAEQLAWLKLKEDKTPSTEHGSVTRYYFDVSTSFITVHETTTVW